VGRSFTSSQVVRDHADTEKEKEKTNILTHRMRRTGAGRWIGTIRQGLTETLAAIVTRPSVLTLNVLVRIILHMRGTERLDHRWNDRTSGLVLVNECHVFSSEPAGTGKSGFATRTSG
jgi:hypothetical protein